MPIEKPLENSRGFLHGKGNIQVNWDHLPTELLTNL